MIIQSEERDCKPFGVSKDMRFVVGIVSLRHVAVYVLRLTFSYDNFQESILESTGITDSHTLVFP